MALTLADSLSVEQLSQLFRLRPDEQLGTIVPQSDDHLALAHGFPGQPEASAWRLLRQQYFQRWLASGKISAASRCLQVVIGTMPRHASTRRRR